MGVLYLLPVLNPKSYDRWVKAHMGIPANESAYIVAKNAAKKAQSLEGHEKRMSGGGIRQWAKWRKRESVEEIFFFFFFFFVLLPVLNPRSYDGARIFFFWRLRAVLC